MAAHVSLEGNSRLNPKKVRKVVVYDGSVGRSQMKTIRHVNGKRSKMMMKNKKRKGLCQEQGERKG